MSQQYVISPEGSVVREYVISPEGSVVRDFNLSRHSSKTDLLSRDQIALLV